MNYINMTLSWSKKLIGSMSNKKVWIIGLAMIALLAILGVFLWIKNEYLVETKTIEVNNRVVHYSLTYPNRYTRDGPGITPQGLYYFSLSANRNKMSLASPDSNKTGSVSVSNVPASIEISIYDVNSYRPVEGRNGRAQLEFILGTEKDEPEFELKDRSTIEICGITAEQATWQAPNPLPFKGLPNRLVRQIYFDRDGYVWEISFFSELSLEKIVSDDFEYVLSTFKIID